MVPLDTRLSQQKDATRSIHHSIPYQGDFMTKRLFVGNLSVNTTEDEIKALFSEHGTVESVNFIRDFDSRQMRGFGFVEVATQDAAIMIAEINGREVGGRALTVNEARPRGHESRRPRFDR